MKSLIYIALILISFSCKKDKLEGEYAIFNGTWNWIYTNHDYGWCEGEGYYEQLTPDSESYSVTFQEKGFVRFFENGGLLEKKRVVIKAIIPNEGDLYDNIFFIHLNNDDENKLRGAFRSDTMILFNFPFVPEPGCEQYSSYFIKQ